MRKVIKILDFVIYWLIVLLPFSIAIAPAPMNVFMGLLIASFILKKVLKNEPIFAPSTLNAPLLLLFAITCISVFNSVDLKGSLRGGVLRLLEYIFVFFAILDSVKDKKHLIKIVFSLIVGLLLVSLDALWQVKMDNSFIRRDYPPIVNIGLVRATSSFKDANMLGIYLSGFAPLVFGLTLFYFKGKQKIIPLFISLLAFLGIALTYSRPTLLGVYIALCFLAIARKNKAMIALMLIFTLVSPFFLPKSVKEWAGQVEYNPLRFMCNDDRIAVYRNSMHMIKAHPVIGVGTNAFMKSYKKYKEFPEYRNIVTLDEMKAHNIYLQIAGEIGLIGLIIFIWLLARLFTETKKIYRALNDNYMKMVCLSLIACLIAFLINGLTESSLQYSRVAPVFWYLCAVALSLKKFAI